MLRSSRRSGLFNLHWKIQPVIKFNGPITALVFTRNNSIKNLPTSVTENLNDINKQKLHNKKALALPFSKAFKFLIESITENELEERSDANLIEELYRLQSDKTLICQVIDSQDFFDFLVNLKNNYPESHGLLTLFLENNFSTAAFYIHTLLQNPNFEISTLLLLDDLVSLLLHGEIELVHSLLIYMKRSKRKYNNLIDLNENEISPLSLSKILIEITCSIGKPLVAASFCLRFDELRLIDEKMIDRVMSLLLIPHPLQGTFYIKAISTLASKLQTVNITLSSEEKAKIIEQSFVSSKFDIPTLVNDSLDLTSKIAGGDVPTPLLFNILKLNLDANNTSRASTIAKTILERGTSINDYDYTVIGSAIRQFSKHRQYRNLAKALALIIPEDYYIVPGLTEALLSYCARTMDEELAVAVYSKLEMPLRRSVLTSLLHLHLAFDDNSGSEQILKEISRRNDALMPVEFSMIVQAMLRQNDGLEKAAAICRKNPPHLARLSYADIINSALTKGDTKIANEFIDIAYENLLENDSTFDTISVLIIKKILLTHGPVEARLQWLQWKSGSQKASKIRLPSPKHQIIALRSIFDKATADQNKSVVDWTFHELRHLGVHMSDIRKELSRRSTTKKFKRIKPDKKLEH